MLLNAANVVTAAENCQAIDEKTGRIPIKFLLSQSNDLEEHVKDQLQQLAVNSPSISILPDRSTSCPSSTKTSTQQQNTSDMIMKDMPQQQQQQNESQPTTFMSEFSLNQQMEKHNLRDDEEEDEDEENDDDQSQDLLSHADSLASLHSTDEIQYQDDEEEEALKDIDRETGGGRQPQDRKLIQLLHQKRNQTLTRKAIRKHTGDKKGGLKSHKLTSPLDTSSTINTRSTCVQSSEGGSSSIQRNHTPRRRWKELEDELLIRVVAENGPTRWNNLAKHFPGRNGRQVRLRWMNHLQPSLDKRPWRPEEDAVLLEAHQALGNKWALISVRLCGRTDNSVKNRYKSIVRRAAREAKARKNE